MLTLTVIGGGLAGPEAAYQAARAGVRVRLYEMRPRISTAAHRTGAMGELVCSNSLKSEAQYSAPWLLKQELRRGGSLLMRCADQAAVPGGQALAVDREVFSAAVERELAGLPNLEIIREEVREISDDMPVIIASGPLTSAYLTSALAQLTGGTELYFYDAISPIVEADSIDMTRVFAGSRYGHGGADYLNCPLTREEYDRFYDILVAAESYPLHSFEEAKFFEACLPLEELARRGRETLRFGPMKPVGLEEPSTGRTPYAAVQLRRENLRCDSYNLVGFQNHLRFGEQARVLRLIPGLENARFVRYGQVHRNTYINAPALLNSLLQLKQHPNVWIAGQLCGTEGYVEAIATGFLAGTFSARQITGLAVSSPPRESALGSLIHYITHASPRDYSPANITFDLLPLTKNQRMIRNKATRHQRQCETALASFEEWWQFCAPVDRQGTRVASEEFVRARIAM
jgi:methylenetetrahydrofolate--tRNA-(uracil-5-)-methyltransferase